MRKKPYTPAGAEVASFITMAEDEERKECHAVTKSTRRLYQFVGQMFSSTADEWRFTRRFLGTSSSCSLYLGWECVLGKSCRVIEFRITSNAISNIVISSGMADVRLVASRLARMSDVRRAVMKFLETGDETGFRPDGSR